MMMFQASRESRLQSDMQVNLVAGLTASPYDTAFKVSEVGALFWNNLLQLYLNNLKLTHYLFYLQENKEKKKIERAKIKHENKKSKNQITQL